MIAKVHLPAVMRSIDLRVIITGRRQAAIRTRLGLGLMRLAAWVIGCSVEVAIDPDELSSQRP